MLYSHVYCLIPKFIARFPCLLLDSHVYCLNSMNIAWFPCLLLKSNVYWLIKPTFSYIKLKDTKLSKRTLIHGLINLNYFSVLTLWIKQNLTIEIAENKNITNSSKKFYIVLVPSSGGDSLIVFVYWLVWPVFF